MTKRASRSLFFLLAILVIATAVATIAVWPEQRKFQADIPAGFSTKPVKATASQVINERCSADGAVPDMCQTITARLTSGPDKGGNTTVVIPMAGLPKPLVEKGDKLVLDRASNEVGAPAAYTFADFQRTMPLVWLGLAFAVVVVLVGRWRGIGSLIGLAATWLVVSGFLMPSILEGHSPVVASIAAGSLICFAALYVAHGLSLRTTTALVGTLLGLALTGLLAYVAVKLANLTGQASEDVIQVQRLAGQVNVQGLLLGGIIIGSLGVLNDVTVTQASAVWEIHRARPSQSTFSLYRAGMRVGRDHIASTVYTIVLAYVGAALPLLVLFSVVQREWIDTLTSSLVAEEVVRTLAGAIGLVLAVPITTVLAAMLAKRSDGEHDTSDEQAPSNMPNDDEPNDTDYDNNESGDEGSDASSKRDAPIRSSGLYGASGGKHATPLHFASDKAVEADATGSKDANGSKSDQPSKHHNEDTGTIRLQAYYNPQQTKRGLLERLGFRRSPEAYKHKMSWGERNFWGEFGTKE